MVGRSPADPRPLASSDSRLPEQPAQPVGFAGRDGQQQNRSILSSVSIPSRIRRSAIQPDKEPTCRQSKGVGNSVQVAPLALDPDCEPPEQLQHCHPVPALASAIFHVSASDTPTSLS